MGRIKNSFSTRERNVTLRAMKLQIALATAVAAARKQLCQDKKQWADCVVAYANGECHSTDECDRTCNKCNTNTCFDMIPHAHTYFYDLGKSDLCMTCADLLMFRYICQIRMAKSPE